LDPRKWARIQELLREERYESVAQFMTVAIENQFQLEEMPTEQAMSTAERHPLASEAITRLSSNISSLTEPPALVQTKEEASDEIIWGLYNRIFPVKITLRVLTELLANSGSKTLELKLLRDEAAVQARVIGRKLTLKDRS